MSGERRVLVMKVIGLAAMAAILAITAISMNLKSRSRPVSMMVHSSRKSKGTFLPFNIVRGQQLCAEGESYCEHPCSAFYTITGKPSPCVCKCTVNTHSWSKGDVICTCPDSPISPENDFYPHVRNATSSNSSLTPAAIAAAATPPGAAAAAPAAGAVRRAVSPVSLFSRFDGVDAMRPRLQAGRFGAGGMPTYRGVPGGVVPRRMEYGMPQGRLMNPWVRPQQGLWIGAPPPMLPPDGDYPGGSSGIPEDGYIGFDTGYADDGPYHGMYAPMQEAGIYQARSPPMVGLRRIAPWAARGGQGLPVMGF